VAVLVEGISVIMRLDRIKGKYPNGWDGFLEDVPNSTLCYDDEIARVGFLSPSEAQSYVELLESRGLAFLEAGHPIDVAVADQQKGLTVPCSWLEFGRLPFGESGGKVGVCWLFEEPRRGHGLHFKGKKMSIATPSGWEYEESLSAEFMYVPTKPAD